MLTPFSSEGLPQGSALLPFSMGHLQHEGLPVEVRFLPYPLALVKAKLRFFHGRPGGQGEGVLGVVSIPHMPVRLVGYDFMHSV